MDADKNCDCGHIKSDHVLIQKKMTKLAYIEKGFFIPIQLGHGICKKCSCPEYKLPRGFRTKRTIEYRVKPMDTLEDSEKRCMRCGTLFEQHSEMNHPFKDKLD